MNNENNTTQPFFSIAFSYRLGLGFHALNNEGSDGSNLMQPRRIDVGKQTYDGISGEIIRHHILENFVSVCRQEQILMLPLSEGLHPDRGPLGIRHAAKKELQSEILNSTNLLSSTRKVIEICAVLDVGGFLAAFSESSPEGNKPYIVEANYIQNNCANLGNADPIKRESCFDVAWLISEEPQDSTITQHSAFRNTSDKNSRYAQVMRSNIYGGIIRADLHRIGMDDNWYLQTGQNRLAISSDEQRRRQKALIKAIVNFIASPTGAKVAAWAPHIFKVEGVILRSQNRAAPFISPISVAVNNNDRPISFNQNYQIDMTNITGNGITTWTFNNQQELLNRMDSIVSQTPTQQTSTK